MAEDSSSRYMKLALSLAKRGRGKTSPNPMVGAVVVKEGRIVGEGYHRRAGTAHAEVLALKEAGGRARGGDLYVNLEPCCHYGRTRPCTDAIIEAGIKRVIYAITDPNPLVDGKGAKILNSNGIKTERGLLENDASHLNEIYLKYIATGRPFVVLKTAQSLDGRIATLTGDSKWISGPEALKFAHRLRAECDAVAVGSGTVRADNPQLTVRLVKGKNPYRIILTEHPDISNHFNIFKNNDDAKTIVATSQEAAGKIGKKNLIVWTIRKNKKGLVLKDFLEVAGQFGIQSLLIEGGSRLATSFLKEGLVDKHHLMIAPLLIGKGLEGIGDLHIRRLTEAVKYREYKFERCGKDMLFTGYPEGK
ncbi:Riboflavin biosynthesis protein RibD (Includes: Diaminohydroxyphosphoribosylaminopyrimidine deaminase; 5-amino-6-(5-phosphoribosylamino)uracil reductase) [Candidatus Zixiibacteriota bacterium]|nr:Riboflavin biosynthesis protein RibD (Includes: Diaminohydroxyphosphoribosylaminopyrimidine deaminase; 5-amino-6-(5-phosphoribosylamino)uracil reductase) [candidate division Zixibacteria bacterium]